MATTTLPTLHVPPGARLPDNDQWTNRFEIHSASSNRVYVIAQHRTKRHWGCSCPSYRTRRYCHHLSSMQLPAHEQPHEVLLGGER
ncbi:MAG TPA: hypothetical protein VFP27_17895 [Mycobacterium sp.]|nr:hypothetical protein [Mycobacterium sp.]